MSQAADGAPGERAALARVLICPDKFRGSLTASQAANALAAGLRHIAPADTAGGRGGEGTVDCCLAAGFIELRHRVTGADGHAVLARIAVRRTAAVIESAQAFGLAEGQHDSRAALAATSSGVGELIGAALDLGCRKLIVGVGGTASTDGGAGLLQALGARLHDGRGAPVAPGGGLAALAKADLSRLDPRLAGCKLLVATDFDNPLLGSRGAAAAFGPQKGADSLAQAQMEQGLARLAALLDRPRGPRRSQLAGAGAGGGIGYALITVGAQRVSGAETVLGLLGFADLARSTSWS